VTLDRRYDVTVSAPVVAHATWMVLGPAPATARYQQSRAPTARILADCIGPGGLGVFGSLAGPTRTGLVWVFFCAAYVHSGSARAPCQWAAFACPLSGQVGTRPRCAGHGPAPARPQLRTLHAAAKNVRKKSTVNTSIRSARGVRSRSGARTYTQS
jgi:hypothetical protein